MGAAAAKVAAPRWVAVSSGATKMIVGQSRRFEARMWDSTGTEFVPTPTVIWVSSQPNSISVDSTGLVTVLKPGQAAIVARAATYPNGPSGSMVVTGLPDPEAANTASVAITPTAITLAPDGSVQLTAAARDVAGASISGRSYTWVSSNPKVATVTAGGLVRAIAIGTATISVACDGKLASATVAVAEPVFVPPAPVVPAVPPTTPTTPTEPTEPAEPDPTPAATPGAGTAPAVVGKVLVMPTSLTLWRGGSLRVSASATTAAGIPIAGKVATWRSLVPAIATIDSTGAVTAVAAGQGKIVATIEGVADTADVTVNEPTTPTTPTGPTNPAPTTPTTPGPTTQPTGPGATLIVARFDGNSGKVLVSNGIPFPQGLVTTTTVNQLHVYVKGVEQPIFVRALSGRHKDGSLRAALVQFEYDVPASGVDAQFTVGGARSAAMTRTEGAVSATPVAAALPTSPDYLISTKLGGTLTPAATPAPTPLIAQYEADFVRIEAIDWKRCGAGWNCGRTAGYDRSFILYQQWMRTGDPKYWHHATASADDYIRKYVEKNAGPAPWWSNSEGVALHYLMTGDERSRTQLRKLAEVMAWFVKPGSHLSMGVAGGDDRMKAKALLAALDARMIDVSDAPAGHAKSLYSPHLDRNTLTTWISELMKAQQANGAFGGDYYLGGQKNFMTGMLLTGLVRYYDEVSADQRVYQSVKRNLEYMWEFDWVAAKKGFKYVSVDSTKEAPRAQSGGAPGLNGLTVTAFAWYYALSGDATYRDKIDLQLAGLAAAERKWWEASGKAFDQGYHHMFNTIAWRSR
jgi:uncharacterized protein YjdB